MLSHLPFCALTLIFVIPGGMAVYYAAVVSGIYKDPLLANFRLYGEERRVLPLCRLLTAAGVACLAAGSLITDRLGWVAGVFTPLIFTVLGGMALSAGLLIRQSPRLAEALPVWYCELLRTSTRQERRLIGYAWLRLPRRMRWRLNGDQAAFRVWADMVRIAVIYGAYDPDNPWTQWT